MQPIVMIFCLVQTIGGALVTGLASRLGSAAHNAVGLAGESPVVGIDCLPTGPRGQTECAQ